MADFFFFDDGGKLLILGDNLNDESVISMGVQANGLPTFSMKRPDNGDESIFMALTENGASIRVGGLLGTDRINITTIGQGPGAQVSVESTQQEGADLSGFRVFPASGDTDAAVEMYLTQEGGTVITWKDGFMSGILPGPAVATASKPVSWGQIKNSTMSQSIAAKGAVSPFNTDGLQAQHEDLIRKARSRPGR